jgi:hypothetical protein
MRLIHHRGSSSITFVVVLSAMLMPVHINLQGVAMRVLREHVLYYTGGGPSASLILSWIRDNSSPRLPMKTEALTMRANPARLSHR